MSINRQNCIAVLLIVLLSHAALTFHVSTHVPADQSNCDYCGGHTDPTQADVSQQTQVLPSTKVRFDIPAVATIRRSTSFIPFQQRAPPTPI